MVVDRGENVTCPVRCGVVYAGLLLPALPAGRASSAAGHDAAAHSGSAAGVEGGPAAAWREEACSLLDCTSHPWVQVRQPCFIVPYCPVAAQLAAGSKLAGSLV